jgi:hypothetical protein
MKTTTLIADVRRAAERYHAYRGEPTFGAKGNPWSVYWEAITRAEKTFGELNKWELVHCWFPPDAVGHDWTWDYHRKPKDYLLYPHESWMGSPIYYYAGQRPTAMVGQPSNMTITYRAYKRDGQTHIDKIPRRVLTLDEHRPELDACAARHGLQWHVPPVPSATISPDASLFIVMTLPNIEVRWLPEQRK